MTSLSQCLHNGYNVHDCTHNEDASVSCASGERGGGRERERERERLISCILLQSCCPFPFSSSLSPSSGCASRIRQYDHFVNKWEGIVEVNHEEEWRAVCDDDWDIEDGKIVCRQLGYTGGIIAVGVQGIALSNEFWLDDLNCNGQEESLCLCPPQGLGIEDCSKNEGAIIACACEFESHDCHVTIMLLSRNCYLNVHVCNFDIHAFPVLLLFFP